jgi:hypothetical protein
MSKFDVWDQKAFPDPMPELDKQKMISAEEEFIEEFKRLRIEAKKLDPHVIQGASETYYQNKDKVDEKLAETKKDITDAYKEKFTYYNLENVIYDDKQTIASAFDFFEELRKRNLPKEESKPIDEEYKPTFVKSAEKEAQKIKTENPYKGKQKIQPNLLSFNDDIDNY